MNPKELTNISPFMQFQRSVYEQQGSGMGLVIARSLVELYGGKLVIQSVPDAGTISIELNIVDS